MNSPVPAVVDVFKFVAVRAIQMTEDVGLNSVIRDTRAETAAGLRSLARLAESTATSDEARRRFGELDLTVLKPLVRAYGQLLQTYDPSRDEHPSATEALAAAGLEDLSGDAVGSLADTAWDALYVAYRSGHGAGPRLDAVTAALRALHFLALARADALLGPGDALAALRATTTVPPPIATVSTPPAVMVSSVETRASETSNVTVAPKVRDLVEGIGRTRRLLDLARGLPTRTRPKLRQASPNTATAAPVQPDAEDPDATHQTVRLTTVTRFLKASKGSMETGDAAVLDRLSINKQTTVPTATGMLQGHLERLIGQLQDLDDTSQALAAVRELEPEFDLSDIVSALRPAARAVFHATPSPVVDVDVRGYIRPLGVGDLKVVKQTLLAYEPGEVAHIENVLHGESKERVHRTLDRVETTVFDSTETTEDTERDTQTTTRFELKTEAALTLKEDMSVKAGVTATASYGPVTITAQGDFAYSTAKDDSTKTSSNFARDVVDRSLSKIQKKVKTERTTKTFHEAEETDTHRLSGEDGNVVGVYRWVDKRYRAQVHNYGQRLMFEFVLPEPAAFYEASQATGPVVPPGAVPPVPFCNLNNQPLSVQDIQPTNYLTFVSRYNAVGVVPPPLEWTYVGTAIDQQSQMTASQTFSKVVKEITIPTGYTMDSHHVTASVITSIYPRLVIQVGTFTYPLLMDNRAFSGWSFDRGFLDWPDNSDDDPRGVVPVTVIGYDVLSYSVHIEATCRRSHEELEKWQLQTFEKIYTAYQALQVAYDEKVKRASEQPLGVAMDGRNPKLNLEIIRRELKKLCLTMLTGSHWNDFDAMTSPVGKLPEVDVFEALAEGPVIQFFEQAFDWEQITYLLYPYFWGRKVNWVTLSNRTDPDPLFAQFRQAGACRVVVPVAPAYTDAMVYFLQSKEPRLADRIWLGGPAPTINDPLYRSIADEFRDQTDDLAGARPDGPAWEFTVPTTLVWLQGDATLPSFE